MSDNFGLREFLLLSPAHQLAAFFQSKGLLGEIFSTLSAAIDGNRLHDDVWPSLSPDDRGDAEADFRQIHELANRKGAELLREVARSRNVDLDPGSGEFVDLNDLEKGFYAFLKHRDVFERARDLIRADKLSTRMWRKRRGLPRVQIVVDAALTTELERSLVEFFRGTGRGRLCKVDHYVRDGFDWFTAYQEDFPRVTQQWRGAHMEPYSHRPVLSVIFVYSEAAGSLDTYIPDGIETVRRLQRIFATTILKHDLGDEPAKEKTYELEMLKDRQFGFAWQPEWGIESVTVRELRLTAKGGSNEKITIEADPAGGPASIYDSLERFFGKHNSFVFAEMGKPSLDDYTVTRARIQVAFLSGAGRRVTRTFTITLPASCTLKQGNHDRYDQTIVAMLLASGIDLSGCELETPGHRPFQLLLDVRSI